MTEVFFIHPPPSGAVPPSVAEDRRRKGLSRTWWTSIISAAVVVAVLLQAAFFFILLRCRRKRVQGDRFGLREFAYSELEEATGGFHKSKLLGTGGSADVFSGQLAVGQTAVAVKRLRERKTGGDAKEFRHEAQGLGLLQHVNLVRLLGYCSEKNRPKILVYEFIPGGTLKTLLHGSGEEGEEAPAAVTLTFAQRMDIVRGIARGIEYCHHFISEPLIHRDIKPANILMAVDRDVNWVPKIADFGLARTAQSWPTLPEVAHLLEVEPANDCADMSTTITIRVPVSYEVQPGSDWPSTSDTSTLQASTGSTGGTMTDDIDFRGHLGAGAFHGAEITTIAGTFGYLDPEYLITGKPSLKSDIYSFGMVLLEILLGLAPPDLHALIDTGMPPSRWLADILASGSAGVVKMVEGVSKQPVTDPDLCVLALTVASACTKEDADARPTMQGVVRWLN